MGIITKIRIDIDMPKQQQRWEIPEPLRQKMIEVARILRHNQTPTEGTLWEQLRNRKRGYKVRRQQPIGPFVVDFFSAEARLIIEIDGSIHALTPGKDRERQELLEQLNLHFLRFSTTQVEQNLMQVLEAIDFAVKSSPSSPIPFSHRGRRGVRTSDSRSSDRFFPPSPLMGEGGRGVRVIKSSATNEHHENLEDRRGHNNENQN